MDKKLQEILTAYGRYLISAEELERTQGIFDSIDRDTQPSKVYNNKFIKDQNASILDGSLDDCIAKLQEYKNQYPAPDEDSEVYIDFECERDNDGATEVIFNLVMKSYDLETPDQLAARKKSMMISGAARAFATEKQTAAAKSDNYRAMLRQQAELTQKIKDYQNEHGL